PDKDTECEARLVVRGWLGRRVKSDSFKIRFDSKPPILDVLPPAREEGEGSVLWLQTPALFLKANEPLYFELCRLTADGKPVSPSPADDPGRQRLEFPPPQETKSATLEPYAPVGNRLERTWKVQWDRVPNLISKREFFTNSPKYDLVIVLDRPP